MTLAQVITQYVTLKQSMGARFHAEAVILKAFSKAMGDVAVADVEAGGVHAYIAGVGPVTRFWHRKYEALLGFYRFAIARGYVACSPLPMFLPKPPKPFVPYVFSHDELQRLLDAAAAYKNRNSHLEANTLRALLLLLYGAGLRISEALSLTLADVDLANSVLMIRESKFYKTRLVPTGPRLTAALATYTIKRRQISRFHSAEAPFFVTRGGSSVKRHMAENAFRRLRDQAKVYRHDGARYQPRLHDLRGTFAVHRLVSWYRQGRDLRILLPKLATYLGHADIGATQRYLTMTPELLHEASMRFERYAMAGGNHD
jgi:integrase/recombinase XerD